MCGCICLKKSGQKRGWWVVPIFCVVIIFYRERCSALAGFEEQYLSVCLYVFVCVSFMKTGIIYKAQHWKRLSYCHQPKVVKKKIQHAIIKLKNAARSKKKAWIWHDAGLGLLPGAEENGHLWGRTQL